MNYHAKRSLHQNPREPLPAGFLLSGQPLTKPSINLHKFHAHNQNKEEQEKLSEESKEILIVDDDRFQVPPVFESQILIKEDDENGDGYGDGDNEIEIIDEELEEDGESEISEGKNGEKQEFWDNSENKGNKVGEISSGNVPDQQEKKDKDAEKHQENQNRHEKPIFRNYSFGKKQQIQSSDSEYSSTVDPLIKRLLDPQVMSCIRQSLSQKKKSVKALTKTNNRLKGKKEEKKEADWKVMIGSFIQKRENWLRIKAESDEKESAKQTGIFYRSEENELASNESGYFSQLAPFEEEGEQKQKPTNQHLYCSQIQSERNQRKIKKQFERQDLSIAMQHQTKTQERYLGYTSSLALISETLPSLPNDLAQTYLKIHSELLKKNYENKQIFNKQMETITLLQTMKKMHESYLKIDCFVLEEGGKRMEKIRANRQIILSLVKKLSTYFQLQL